MGMEKILEMLGKAREGRRRAEGGEGLPHEGGGAQRFRRVSIPAAERATLG